LSKFKETCVLSTYIRKSTQIPNYIKIRPVAADLFRADGQT